MEMSEKNITFEIKEHLGVITRFESGWNRELNIISWNGAAAKYDLRDWDPHHERMRKGITLHAAEMRKLVDLYLNNNTRKAVEEGRRLEKQRRDRQREQFEQSAEARGAIAVAVDAESYEAALPPEPEVAEGEDLSCASQKPCQCSAEEVEESRADTETEQESVDLTPVQVSDATPF